jgi:hypothetical protein
MGHPPGKGGMCKGVGASFFIKSIKLLPAAPSSDYVLGQRTHHKQWTRFDEHPPPPPPPPTHTHTHIAGSTSRMVKGWIKVIRMTKSKLYYDRQNKWQNEANQYSWYLRYVYQRLTYSLLRTANSFMTKISIGLLTNFSNEGGVAHPWLLSKA